MNTMAVNKHLGRGLDLLLSSSGRVSCTEDKEIIDSSYVEGIFLEATQADDNGNTYEAYHLYRTVSDYIRERSDWADSGLCQLASQALNNAAIILFENGQVAEAGDFLRQACKICPENEVARDNLKLIGL